MRRARSPIAIRIVSTLLRIGAIMSALALAWVLAGLVLDGGPDAAAGAGGPGGVVTAWLAPILLAVLAWVQLLASRHVEYGGSRLWWIVAFSVFALLAGQSLLDGMSIAWLAVAVLGMVCLLMPSARSHLWPATPLVDTDVTEHEVTEHEVTEHDV